MRRAAIPAAALALVFATSAAAAWSAAVAGSGAARARSMPTGNVPTGSASGRNVSLTWAASTIAPGIPAPGYRIRRFNSVTNAEDTVLASCSGTITTTSCTEKSVPTGSWTYTVTPVAGSWLGTQSAKSAAVTVTI